MLRYRLCGDSTIAAARSYQFHQTLWRRQYLAVDGMYRMLREFVVKESPRGTNIHAMSTTDTHLCMAHSWQPILLHHGDEDRAYSLAFATLVAKLVVDANHRVFRLVGFKVSGEGILFLGEGGRTVY